METIAIIHTNKGDITIELNREKAPITTENFINYAKEGFYENTIFHRVIDGFMIQGGGLESGMKDKKSTKAPIKNEANNGLSNVVGSIAMARTNDPHSASSQFFINVKDNDFLDFKSEDMYGWGYTVFGKVIEGMDVVDAIRQVKTQTVSFHENVPVEDIVISAVTVK